MEFTIPAMSCSHCVRAITETLTAIDAKALVTIDLPSQHVTVQTTQSHAAVTAALVAAGYPAA